MTQLEHSAGDVIAPPATAEDNGTGVVVQLSRKRGLGTARARTTSIKRLSKTELARGRVEYPPEETWRPRTRGECVGMERPCPFVSCRYHLALDVHPTRGSIKINFPNDDVDDRAETCSLDVADGGGETLEVVAQFMNLTRERVRQLETRALATVLARAPQLRRLFEQGNE